MVGLLLILLGCLGFPLSDALAEQLNGQVVGVIDGDTIEVLHNQRGERIRLNGIDCPEKGQAYGQKAKQATSALVFGKEVTLQTHGKDKHGRTIADVLLSGGTNVNQMLVKDGCAGDIRSMHPTTVRLNNHSRKRNKQSEAYGMTQILFHLGSIAGCTLGLSIAPT